MIAIIGGSGLTNLKNLEITRKEVMRTPYGEPSASMVFGQLGGQDVVFLPRHGSQHTIPPHEINYRANMWALREAGADRVLAVAAVGGISDRFLTPGTLVLPDQILDYTYGREHTYFSGADKKVIHVDFTEPYCSMLRNAIISGAGATEQALVISGTYAATQGPRFETRAEVRRLEQDGADIVGMTGLPEAALARELGICYAHLALVVNPAAGKGTESISLDDINMNLSNGMKTVRRLLETVIPLCADGRCDCCPQ